MGVHRNQNTMSGARDIAFLRQCSMAKLIPLHQVPIDSLLFLMFTFLIAKAPLVRTMEVMMGC